MKPESRKKKPTKTKPLSKMGASACMWGGVKWKKTMESASRVRRPVSAGSWGLRAAGVVAVEAGWTAVAVVNGGSSLSLQADSGSLDEERRGDAAAFSILCD